MQSAVLARWAGWRIARRRWFTLRKWC